MFELSIANTLSSKSHYTEEWRGYFTSGSYFGRFCVFSQKIKQLRTKYPTDLVIIRRIYHRFPAPISMLIHTIPVRTKKGWEGGILSWDKDFGIKIPSHNGQKIHLSAVKRWMEPNKERRSSDFGPNCKRWMELNKERWSTLALIVEWLLY